jgi:acylphosphatase
MPEQMIRAHVTIHGRVQGVFYRLETQRAAMRLGVVGWVKNRPEKTVEAVFEGPKSTVENMVQWCWQGSPMARVSQVDVQWQAWRGKYTDFSVRY